MVDGCNRLLIKQRCLVTRNIIDDIIFDTPFDEI